MKKDPKIQEIIDLAPTWFERTCDFSCCDGWFDLIKSIILEAKRLGFNDDEIKIDQIKEKFGGLRFYHSFTKSVDAAKVKDLNAFIDLTEDKSYKTCEFCASEKDVVVKPVLNSYWIRALCNSCRSIENNKRFNALSEEQKSNIMWKVDEI